MRDIFSRYMNIFEVVAYDIKEDHSTGDGFGGVAAYRNGSICGKIFAVF